MMLFIAGPVRASFEWTEGARQAYHSIITLRFQDGRRQLEAEKQLHPDNDILPFIENYIDFLTVFLHENKAEFQQLLPNKDARLKLLDEAPKNSPWYLLTHAEVNLQWAFARLRFGEYMPAAMEINKAYRLLTRNAKLYPDFIPNRKSLGLLHALIGTIPDEYAWAKNLIGVEGSVSQGVNEMMSVLEAAGRQEDLAFLKTETFFLVTFAQLNLELEGISVTPGFKALIGQLFTEDEYANNPLYVYSSARIAMDQGDNEKAISILQRRPTDTAYEPFPYLEYLLGTALQGKLDAGAAVYFESYLKHFKGKSYLKAARQRLAWIQLLAGNEARYREIMEQVKTSGNTTLGADKQAMQAAESGVVPNVKLLKARLLFDGGYFNKSLQVLVADGNARGFDTREERVEFVYRLARIHQELQHADKAKTYFDMTIRDGETLPLYYAANAALQLGMMYEKEGDLEEARKYYRKCISLKDHEYAQSLSQKAKAGLNRVGEK
ncbi:MAG: tetratricopeptide repeat protein [Flavobacteriales bacterium]|nr:tetratricopeptide repeat protein [Flavobacteriales bacterium]MCB9447192.1 tetratricopeptide repeat protein [Flavobacteriales bacterium]